MVERLTVTPLLFVLDCLRHEHVRLGFDRDLNRTTIPHSRDDDDDVVLAINHAIDLMLKLKWRSRSSTTIKVHEKKKR